MALKARADLVNDVLANYGIIQQADAATVRTRAELVAAALANLGVLYQTDAGTAKTLVSLIDAVSFILGIGAVGQTLDAENYAIINGRVPTVVADLNARTIATVSDTNAIPAAWFDALAAIVANTLRDTYGITAEEATRIAAAAQIAESRLKSLTRAAYVDLTIPSIIAGLNARGIATISNVNAIPSAWFDPLTDIVSDAARALCDVSAETAQRVAARAPLAERTLRNLTRTYLIDRNIDQILAELAADEIIETIDPAEIPDEIYPALTCVVANRCKGRFELDALTLQRVTAEGIQGERTLIRILRGRPSYLVQPGTYF